MKHVDKIIHEGMPASQSYALIGADDRGLQPSRKSKRNRH